MVLPQKNDDKPQIIASFWLSRISNVVGWSIDFIRAIELTPMINFDNMVPKRFRVITVS
jgi:hypothetical protein